MTQTTVSISDVQKQIERDYRWNFTVNALDGASFWFGMSFISYTIILPLYVSHFTTNPILIGLIPLFSTSGYLFPQIFTANAIERAPRKKFFPVTIGFFLERLPIILLAPSAYFFATNRPGLALATFFILYAWHTFGAGLIVVGWQDLIAKIIPVDKRGRFFGITNFLGNGAGILGALAVPFIIEKFTFPLGYVISYKLSKSKFCQDAIFATLYLPNLVFSRFSGLLSTFSSKFNRATNLPASQFLLPMTRIAQNVPENALDMLEKTLTCK
jgi:hypothetical protein